MAASGYVDPCCEQNKGKRGVVPSLNVNARRAGIVRREWSPSSWPKPTSSPFTSRPTKCMQGYVFDRARDEIVCHFRRAPPGEGYGRRTRRTVAPIKLLTCVMSLRPTGRATVHGLP